MRYEANIDTYITDLNLSDKYFIYQIKIYLIETNSGY